MALISTARLHEKKQVKIEISSDILQKIESYCKWSKIEVNFFFEEAAAYVFSKDKDWKLHNKSAKKASRLEKA